MKLEDWMGADVREFMALYFIVLLKVLEKMGNMFPSWEGCEAQGHHMVTIPASRRRSASEHCKVLFVFPKIRSDLFAELNNSGT